MIHKTAIQKMTNGSASEQNFFSESDSENSDTATVWPEKKNKTIVEESGSESEGINIKLEQFLPSFGIKETTIIFCDDESQDESKSNINTFIPVKQVENTDIFSHSD